MAGYVLGGGNLLVIYEGIDSEHNLSASTYANASFEFNQIAEIGVDRDEATGYYGFTVTSVQMSPTLSAKQQLWAPPSTGGEVEEVTYTNGNKIGGNTGSSPDLLAINYGAIHTDSGINQLPVVTTVVKATLGMGGRTESPNTMGRPNLVFVGQKVKKEISVPAALYCSAIVDVASPVVLPVNGGGVEQWMDPA